MGEQETFGTLLRRYRGAAGMTQEMLAERAGLSVRGLSDLERGMNRAPHAQTMQLLAAALGLSEHERAALEAAARRSSRSSVAMPAMTAAPSRNQARAASSPPLVGRVEELRLVDRHLQGESPPVLALAGEPGIGKTRLLEEAARRATVAGWQVLAGGCTRRAGQQPYAPLLEALQRRLAGRSTVEQRTDLLGCAWLVRLLPELAGGAIEPLPEWSLPPEQERRLMFAAVERYLANVAGPSGAMLVLDDLQWAGADALDLLMALARGASATGPRFVCAYRDTDVQPGDPLAAVLSDLAHAGLVLHHPVGPLDDREAGDLLARLAGESRRENLAIEETIQRTGGVPFFLVSYAREPLRQRSPAAVAAETPWSVAHSIRQRLAVLPTAARELVSAAAVVGRIVSRPLLMAVVTQPEAEMVVGLEAVCRARLLEEAGDDAYQFAHDVIHEVVRGDLGAAQRAALHRRIAEILDQRSVELPVELLAYHYERAGEYVRAIAYLVTAAERARHHLAYREVAGLLALAVTLAERLGQHGRAAELRAMRGETLCSVGLWAEARVELESSLENLAPARVERRAEVLVELARAHWWLLDCPTSGRCAHEALELADKAGRDDLALRAFAYLAQVPKSEGHMMQSRAICLRGLARPGGDRNPALLEAAPLVHYLIGQTDEAIRLGRVAVETIRGTRDAGSTANAMTNLGLALAAGGQYDEAMRVFEEARRLGREYEVQTILARAMACATGLHLDVFDYPGAEAHAMEAYEMARSVNWSPAAVSAGIDLLFTFIRGGDVGKAEALLDEVVRLSELPGSFHEWQWRIRLNEARAELALSHDDCEQAWRWVNQSLKQSRISRRTKYRVIGLDTRARVSMMLGQVDAAIVDLRRALKLARLVGDPAQFLRVATSLLAINGDELLVAEASATADRIAATLSDETMRRRFRESDIVRALERC